MFMTFKIMALIASLLFMTGCSETEQETKTEIVSAGEEIFKKNCKVCHASGLNGAPIFGNKKMWKDRAVQPLPTLVEHATNGFGLMPAKGGNEALTEQEIELAIKHMLSALET